MREPSDSAAAAAEVFRDVGVRWTLVGALAAQRYRRTPRLTTDADFLVESLAGLDVAFTEAGYRTQVFADEGDEPHLLVVRGLGDRIDVMAAIVEYQRIALERAVENVLTVEDVIVHKLIAWRPRDRDDIASILDAGVDLDAAYIERWATEWEVSDRWEAAFRAR